METVSILTIIPIVISAIALIISVRVFYLNKGKKKHSVTPTFKISTKQKFDDNRYTMIVEEVTGNYAVFKNAYDSRSKLNCKYVGINQIAETKKQGNKELEKIIHEGHTIEFDILDEEDFDTTLIFEFKNFFGKSVIVKTPVLHFVNKEISNFSVDGRFLEYIKK